MLHLKYFKDNSKICVVEVLLEYLNRTSSIRNSCTSLWISFNKPHKAVGKETLSRWLKLGLSLAKVDTSVYSSHSFRHVSTSCAFQKGVNIDVIFSHAGWSPNSTVFARFYNRPVVSQQSFSQAVLS